MIKATDETNIHAQERARAVKKTILIVDDNTDLLQLNKAVLEIDDYEVFTALGGRAALALLSKIDAPDLILLDLCMEGMSGPDFLVLLEEEMPEIIKAVPIVFLTGMDNVPESKAVGFIRKPAEIDDFLEAVHRFIEAGTGHVPYKH